MLQTISKVKTIRIKKLSLACCLQTNITAAWRNYMQVKFIK